MFSPAGSAAETAAKIAALRLHLISKQALSSAIFLKDFLCQQNLVFSFVARALSFLVFVARSFFLN
jgi:hypothetical protein